MTRDLHEQVLARAEKLDSRDLAESLVEVMAALLGEMSPGVCRLSKPQIEGALVEAGLHAGAAHDAAWLYIHLVND